MSKSNDAGSVVLVGFGVVAAAIALVVWGAFFAGLALSILWSWFMVPLFGLPTLTLWQAYGVALCFRALHGLGDNSPKREAVKVLIRATVGAPIICAVILAVGWCVKFWAFA